MLIQKWWRDRRDSPAFWWQLRGIREAVRLACAADPPPRLDISLDGQLPDINEKSPILLACCDEVYFYRFGRQLAFSMQRHSPAVRIHLHLFDPSPLCIADVEMLVARLGNQLSFSYEGNERNPYVKPHGIFFATGRFAIAGYFADRNRVPVMVIDIDGAVRRDLAEEFAALATYDVGAVFRDPTRMPWRRILACAVYINTTDAARLFAARMGKAMELAVAIQPPYHIDQTTLYYLLDYYSSRPAELSVTDLGRKWCDHKFQEGSLIWSAKGKLKAEFLQMNMAEARKIASGA